MNPIDWLCDGLAWLYKRWRVRAAVARENEIWWRDNYRGA